MKPFFIVLGFFLLPLAAHAAADLSISPTDIRFSSDVLVAGDQVRIYAKVYNVGDEDVSGYVSFYQGATLIDDSLVISLLADGSPEEVYIDFIVPEGSFNILALLRGMDPIDINSSNDSALTSTFTPVVDNDRDGIDNANDNCPDESNNAQLDTDADGQGDVCDPDDDNDGLSDEVEAELSTNSTQQDTDGDGVTDQDDAYPTDADQTVVEEEPEPVAQETAVPSSEAFQKIVEEVAKTIKESVPTTQEKPPEVSVDDQEIHLSPNAVFTYTQDDWNAFTFTVRTNRSEQVVSIWNFGDGVTSSKSDIQHVYNTSGAFPVTLTITDKSGKIISETTTVFVPFFHLKNPLILTSVISLLVLLLIGVASFVRLGKKQE
ncbi:PKD domain-containing protein [Candidatus Uhrbacteria bacterium]|nr:PKD domain-containing protein [Candidatus Uhrbacteria bacterium]